MTLRHIDVARESAAQVLAYGDKALLRFKANWQTARGQEDRLGILAARSQLLDYMAAGRIVGDTQCHEAAREALLEQAEAFVERFQPVNEILLVELSLALIARRLPLARALSKAVLNRAITGSTTLESHQAQSLAALQALDYPQAQNIAKALAIACQSKKLDKQRRVQGLHWANAVQQLSTGEPSAAQRSVQQARDLHVRNIDSELAKLKRGGESAFAPFDLLDLPGAALLSLIEDVTQR